MSRSLLGGVCTGVTRGWKGSLVKRVSYLKAWSCERER